MSTHNIAAAGRDGQRHDLDTLFDVLAHPHRRTVVEELEPGVVIDLDTIAERIVARDASASMRETKIQLVHSHLPRLDDAGLVSYDRDARVCELDDAATARSILAAAGAR